jgi:hypothetical protein
MRKSLTALALMLAATAEAGVAVAQGVAPIDIKGRWVAMSDAIVRGNAPHHAPAAGGGIRTDHIQITYTITNQDGRRFWGTISTKRGDEPIMGVIGFDGKTVVARDNDGLYQGNIIDRDTIDVIYSHANKDSVVVAAHRFTRQK